MCSPVDFCIVASIASLRRWCLTKADIKTAFLQTGLAERDVYVIPPVETADRSKCLWLLLGAPYGLVNANAKWQVLSDLALFETGFKAIAILPQLFYMKAGDGLATAELSKIVDDILVCGDTIVVDPIIDFLKDRFTLGTIVHRPGLTCYFRLKIIQHDDYTVSIDGDDKLSSISSTPITRTRRREAT